MSTRRTPSRAARGLTVALVAGLLSATGLVLPAHAAVGSRVALQGPVHELVTGETLHLSGTSTPRVSRPVLYQRAESGRWVTRATGRTTMSGGFRFRTRALATPRVGYRVYLPGTRTHGRTYAAAVSRAVFVRTVPQSGTLTVPSTSRAVNERFTAAAAFTPARPGRLTWLEARTGSTWTRVSAMVRQSSTGRVTLSSYGRKAGTTTYRAVTGALSGAPAATSPQQVLDVTPTRTTLLGGDGSSRRSAAPRFTTITTDQPLVASDTNGRTDVYLLDRRSDSRVLVSHTPSGNGGNSESWGGSVSADGAWVVFPSEATDLAGYDTNSIEDVFLFERATGKVTRLTSFAELPGDGMDYHEDYYTRPTISDDGTLVAYQTYDSATTGSSSRQIVLVDRSTGMTTIVPQKPGTGECSEATFSGDASHLAFTCYDDHGPHLYVRDLVAGTTQQVSTESTGYFGYLERYYELSADGRYLVYMHDVKDQDRYTVAWRDLQTGAVHRFPSPGTGDAGFTGYPHLSADGTQVGVETTLALDPRDHNGVEDAYVWNLADDSTELVSLNAAGTAAGNDRSTSPVLTADGFALFSSKASDLVVDDTNGHEWDAFERDLH